MSDSDNGYLDLLYNTHWAIYIFLLCWFCWGFTIFFQAFCIHTTRTTLKSKSKCVKGLVIANNHEFGTITYVFNANSNKRNKASFNTLLLIDGYAKMATNNKKYFLPSSITELIAIFYVKPIFDSDSIFAIVPTKVFDLQQEFEIGKEIDIMFDPKQPKLRNMPKIVIENQKDNKTKSVKMILSTLCCIAITIALYLAAVIDKDLDFGNAVLFILTLTAVSSISAALYLCCFYWLIRTLSSNKYSWHQKRIRDAQKYTTIEPFIEVNQV